MSPDSPFYHVSLYCGVCVADIGAARAQPLCVHGTGNPCKPYRVYTSAYDTEGVLIPLAKGLCCTPPHIYHKTTLWCVRCQCERQDGKHIERATIASVVGSPMYPTTIEIPQVVEIRV